MLAFQVQLESLKLVYQLNHLLLGYIISPPAAFAILPKKTSPLTKIKQIRIFWPLDTSFLICDSQLVKKLEFGGKHPQ